MKKLLLILFINIFILVVFILAGLINEDPIICSIVDKYEYEDQCYLQIEVEVSPEEYIGYDIGDEYEY